MTRRNIIFLGILAVMGAGWGITQPLTKIAVSTGYRHFGLIFWQLALGAVALAIVRSFAVTRNDRRQFVSLRLPTLRKDPPALLVYVVIALIGTILPNSATYEAIRHLLIGHAAECDLDSQGRVLVAQSLRDFAHLGKRIKLIGQGNKFELWEESQWQDKREELLGRIDDLLSEPSESLSSLVL